MHSRLRLGLVNSGRRRRGAIDDWTGGHPTNSSLLI